MLRAGLPLLRQGAWLLGSQPRAFAAPLAGGAQDERGNADGQPPHTSSSVTSSERQLPLPPRHPINDATAAAAGGAAAPLTGRSSMPTPQLPFADPFAQSKECQRYINCARTGDAYQSQDEQSRHFKFQSSKLASRTAKLFDVTRPSSVAVYHELTRAASLGGEGRCGATLSVAAEGVATLGSGDSLAASHQLFRPTATGGSSSAAAASTMLGKNNALRGILDLVQGPTGARTGLSSWTVV